MQRFKVTTIVLSIVFLVFIGAVVYSLYGEGGQTVPVFVTPTINPTATRRPSTTVKPTPTIKPTAKPTLKPATTMTPRAASSRGPSIGTKLSYDDGLYFLGGGGKIGGVSTTKFRYYNGSEFFVVYLDSKYVVKKVEDYLPGSSSKGKSSDKKDSSKKKSSDPYNASNYLHPDDFYYDYYDDFWDYEDAEEYWKKYH